ncbi:SPFH domain-containing protein [Pseudomonas serbica]|jgi:regulator of protease activity HflC (stomatin/prohibitin superfamily)|uniref:SPFH domain-containing protein n=1 Tax=Pseudomonas serbica TaxID=2965074 RepID=UPI00237A887D|nr:SPFH domain-containing protein [Pseudomonas serbica]
MFDKSEFQSVDPSVKKKTLKWAGIGVLAVASYFTIFDGFLYYNEAGYQSHIRTIWGTEKVVDTLGYAVKGFGSTTAWPREMTAQSVSDPSTLRLKGDFDGLGASLITSFPVTFLGGVTATVDSNVRIVLPKGDQFLAIARGYRNPENFIQMALIPSMKNTLQSTAQMMTADEFYSGGRSEFASNFRDQISDGIFLVNRNEITKNNPRATKTAILQAGTEQGEYGDNVTTKFVTEKVMRDGVPVRLDQQFRKLGVSVAEASITDISPNQQFRDRMVNAQKSQADLSLARLDRSKEEEQKRLVTARGEREVEEKRQGSLKEQVEMTTQAETKRQLVLIEAGREKERAEIEKQTAQITFDKAQIEAKTTKERADAEAYAKKALLLADGALKQKLDAWVETNRAWADASAKAPVPGVMLGGGGDGNGAGSRQADLNTYMQVIAAKSLKDLSLDVSVKQ